MSRKIESFIVKGSDYFTANLADGSVRIGLLNYGSLDYPQNHPRAAIVRAVDDEKTAEVLFDHWWLEG